MALALLSSVDTAFTGASRDLCPRQPPPGESRLEMKRRFAQRDYSWNQQDSYTVKLKPKQMSQSQKAFYRQKPMKVPNVKEKYYILWTRSSKIKRWYPFNLISGDQLLKMAKGAEDNEIAQKVGLASLAQGQIIKRIGMQIYEKMDDTKKEVLKMHPVLTSAEGLQFGFREIDDNEAFNENAHTFFLTSNITLIPPESELRNIIDDAGTAITKTKDVLSEAGENLKGFFSSFSSR